MNIGKGEDLYHENVFFRSQYIVDPFGKHVGLKRVYSESSFRNLSKAQLSEIYIKMR